jgi:hypothetical protein
LSEASILFRTQKERLTDSLVLLASDWNTVLISESVCVVEWILLVYAVRQIP